MMNTASVVIEIIHIILRKMVENSDDEFSENSYSSGEKRWTSLLISFNCNWSMEEKNGSVGI